MMEIKKLTGGQTMGVKEVESFVPEDLDAPKFVGGTPGSIEGNTGAGVLISEASKLEHGIPSVARVRVVFKDIGDEKYLLIIPTTDEGTNTYKLTLKRKAPTVNGLKKLFKDADIPLREDQWYVLTAELVQDDREGYAVACNWTKAQIRARDIVRERKMRAEADRRRREKRKQNGDGPSKSKGA